MNWAYLTVHTPLVPGFNHLLLVSQCHYATRSYPRGGCSLRRWSELFCMSLLCELVVNGVNLESRSTFPSRGATTEDLAGARHDHPRDASYSRRDSLYDVPATAPSCTQESVADALGGSPPRPRAAPRLAVPDGTQLDRLPAKRQAPPQLTEYSNAGGLGRAPSSERQGAQEPNRDAPRAPRARP